MLRIQGDQVESERAAAAAGRTPSSSPRRRGSPSSRVTSTPGRLELESAHQERAQASAQLAQQLAGIAERERELKRERAAIDARRQEAEARIAAREQDVRQQDEAALRARAERRRPRAGR